MGGKKVKGGRISKRAISGEGISTKTQQTGEVSNVVKMAWAMLVVSLACAIALVWFWMRVCPDAYLQMSDTMDISVAMCYELFGLSGGMLGIMVIIVVDVVLLWKARRLAVSEKKEVWWVAGAALVSMMVGALCSPLFVKYMGVVALVAGVVVMVICDNATRLKMMVGHHRFNIMLMIGGGVLALLVLIGLCVVGMQY